MIRFLIELLVASTVFLQSFYSLQSTAFRQSPILQTFQRALTASVDTELRGDKERPFSGVTRSGKVWRKVPENDARSVTDAVQS